MSAKIVKLITKKELEEQKKRKESIERILKYAKTLKWKRRGL